MCSKCQRPMRWHSDQEVNTRDGDRRVKTLSSVSCLATAANCSAKQRKADSRSHSFAFNIDGALIPCGRSASQCEAARPWCYSESASSRRFFNSWWGLILLSTKSRSITRVSISLVFVISNFGFLPPFCILMPGFLPSSASKSVE